MKGGIKNKRTMRKSLFSNKKGQTGGLVSSLVFGIAGLVIGTVIAFIIVGTLLGAGLLNGLSTPVYYNTTADNLGGNFSTGVNNVASKLPTVLLVSAVVLIISVLVVLVAVWQRMRMGGGQL